MHHIFDCNIGRSRVSTVQQLNNIGNKTLSKQLLTNET